MFLVSSSLVAVPGIELYFGATVIDGRAGEDRAFTKDLEDGYKLYVVLDGHGGKDCACKVEEIFHKNLVDSKNFPENISLALRDAFWKTDQDLEGVEKEVELRGKTVKKPAFNDCGTTASVAVVAPDGKVTIAHVGDSRVMISIGDEVIFQTEDHKPSEVKERQRIQEADGFVFRGRVSGILSVSRSLGDFYAKPKFEGEEGRRYWVTPDPDVYPRQFEGSDDEFMVIASDGLWDMMDCKKGEGEDSKPGVMEFVQERLAEGKSAQEISKALAGEARRLWEGKHPGRPDRIDDITVLVVIPKKVETAE